MGNPFSDTTGTTHAPDDIPMNPPPEHILVLGHKNPDTDAAVSAYGYAEFLRVTRRYEHPVSAAIAGALPPQAEYVFRAAGVEPPVQVTSLAPRVGDVAQRSVQSLGMADRLRDAVTLLVEHDLSALPILDADGRVHATYSHRRDIGRFLLGCSGASIVGTLLDWNDLSSLPGARRLGTPPANPALTGRVRLALEDSGKGRDDDTSPRSWREEVEPGDVLLCASMRSLFELPIERRPRFAILVRASDDRLPDESSVRALEASGTSLIAYERTVEELISSLILQVRLGALDIGTGPCVGEEDFLADVENVIREARHAIPVLRGDGRLAGIVSRSDLRRPTRRRIVLVDHFETSQAVPGLAHAEVLEIIDHHRVGDIETPRPVRIDCRPVGSSSTIVASNWFEAGARPSPEVATLLLGGIIADTLFLQSPTTTNVDRVIAPRLAEIARRDLRAFGLEVLRAGDDLLTSDPRTIWRRDQKAFSIRNHTFAVAQLETVSLEDLPATTLEALREALVNSFPASNHLVSLLFVTDVVAGESWVTAAELPTVSGVTASCFGRDAPAPGWTRAPGIVSRKKQVIPLLMRALSESRLLDRRRRPRERVPERAV
jgi:manganese-dependent inorganic pyrophosphatase